MLLIVCEGEQTEPNYFRAFRVSSMRVSRVEIKGTGHDTKSLVRESRRLAAELREDSGASVEVWCVFDRDSFPAAQFHDAISEAGQAGFRCAWSNEAFELWFLLHFDFHTAGLSRSQYAPKLEARLGRIYAKNAGDMRAILKDRELTAIQIASHMESEHAHAGRAAAESNPGTTVHHLIRVLRDPEGP